MKVHKHLDDAIKDVKDTIIKKKLVKKGDKIVIISSRDFSQNRGTNTISVEEI